MEKPRLRFTLLGRFRYAIGRGEYKELAVAEYASAILAYMAFSGTGCSYYTINENCWEDGEKPNSKDALRNRLNSVKSLFTKNNLNWQDYIIADGDKEIFFLKPGMYKTDLKTFNHIFEVAERKHGEKYDRLMSKAHRCYNGSCDLLEGVKGKWIDAKRTEIKSKAKKAREAAERYTIVAGTEGAAVRSAVLEQEAEHPGSSQVAPVEPVEEEALSSYIVPELPSVEFRVQDVGTIRRRRSLLRYGWVFIGLLVVALLVGLLTYSQHDTATSGDSSDSIHPIPRPIIFDVSDWRPGNEPLQIGVTPEKGFTKIYFFHLKKPVDIPAGATKLYASIQCEDKAHIVQADLVEPEGNTEDAASYQTRRQWEWKLRQDGRTGGSKTMVEMVVWLGVNPSDVSSPRFEGTYWFDPPPKEN